MAKGQPVPPQELDAAPANASTPARVAFRINVRMDGSSREQTEAGGLRERGEITISSQERDDAVEAALGDEGVAETRLSTGRQPPCPQLTGTLPVAIGDIDQRQVYQARRDVRIQPRIAEELRQHNGWHEHVPVLERVVERRHVVTPVALQECDPGAGIGRDHRSAFSWDAVRENRTLPRIPRSRA